MISNQYQIQQQKQIKKNLYTEILTTNTNEKNKTIKQ